MRYLDLPYPHVKGSFLYCHKCGGMYAADRGDYFWAGPDDKASCSNGHRPIVLRLMTRRTYLEEVAV